jgi:hypothetical protein
MYGPKPLAFSEYFLLAPEPVPLTSFASDKLLRIVVICAEVSFVAVAAFATVEAGFAASFSRTRRAFGSAIALKMSVIT